MVRKRRILMVSCLLLALINPMGCVGHYAHNVEQKEQDLQKREAELQKREAELNRREEELKKREAPPKAAAESPLQKKGSPAPEFVLEDIQGNKVGSARFRGKNTVIIYFVTWCGFCRKTLPLLDKLYTTYKDKNLEVIGIALDKEGLPAVKVYLEKNPLSFKVLIGYKEMAQRLGITGFPKAILVDKDWRIRNYYPGAVGYEVFEKDLLSLMGTNDTL